MPVLMVVLRSVEEEAKAFALGIQFVIFRLFGYIPSGFRNVFDIFAVTFICIRINSCKGRTSWVSSWLCWIPAYKGLSPCGWSVCVPNCSLRCGNLTCGGDDSSRRRGRRRLVICCRRCRKFYIELIICRGRIFLLMRSYWWVCSMMIFFVDVNFHLLFLKKKWNWIRFTGINLRIFWQLFYWIILRWSASVVVIFTLISFGKKKNGIEMTIREAPQIKNPPHHIPIQRRSDESTTKIILN